MSPQTITPETNFIVAAIPARDGNFDIKRVSALPERAVVVDDDFFKDMTGTQIDAYSAVMLGKDKVGRSSTKRDSIRRFMKIAAALPPAEIVPAQGAEKSEKKKTKKAKEPKPPREIVFLFDPKDEAQKTAFENLAPQGKACVLAGLGLKHPPVETKTHTVTQKSLEEHLEKRRDVFETEQSLMRIFGYHRPMLVAGGFVNVKGGSRSVRATDTYVYHFKFPATDKARKAYDELPPQAQTCLDIALGLKSNIEKQTVAVEDDISGYDWREKLFKAKAAGKLATKQNPFRIFQYHERLLVAADFLRVTTDKKGGK